ncbi:response regulator transcription factor [Streptomyces sp. P01-B04]|uniref:Response regulator transcription factor n=1 Tax=Streptomyces poriferorum TaxID=2798799 RepID=A0ABY9IRP8_9ACTN|nr:MULTISPECIES: response regulator transcription factor [Streptomyces]MBW5253205.1 response regulator transcription factor [Streptomyces poriferorum]MBW5261864.1 response regulator transcription factor [Streptomyces poriferorum]MDP5312922.1 response regulator transcription factor [Streptomyces sp. Alt4]WLQ58070.1 response regulator transcription factor [Streptomyces sp. Alt2]
MRIVLAEDSVLLREGLIGLLERFGHQVVAGAGTADELIAAVAAHVPDIVVTDVRMPPGFSDEGLRAAIELRTRQPELPVLVLSQYVQRAYAEDLLDSADGAGVGYLLKERIGNVEEFVDALHRVAAGNTVVDPEVVRHLIRRRRDPLSRLTAREQEVLALMAEGRSNASIAAAMTVSEGTVSKHFGSILGKLDLSLDDTTNRRVLAVLAYLRG